MIDRISVSPNAQIQSLLNQANLRGTTVVTERLRYLVIEDWFAGDRPCFCDVPGVYIVPLADVRRWENMKLRTLNALHSFIAGIGIVLGFGGRGGVAKAMKDPDIRMFCERLLDLVVPSLDAPNGKCPREFAREVLERLSNENVPDDPFRIAMGATDKIRPRFTESMFDILDRQGEQASAHDVKLLLFAIAGVFRYMAGVDDHGNDYDLADDPRRHEIDRIRNELRVGDSGTASAVRTLIADSAVMGRNLFQVDGAGDIIELLLAQMLQGEGAVRQTLRTILVDE
jgi:fructuronate reductase